MKRALFDNTADVYCYVSIENRVYLADLSESKKFQSMDLLQLLLNLFVPSHSTTEEGSWTSVLYYYLLLQYWRL